MINQLSLEADALTFAVNRIGGEVSMIHNIDLKLEITK
jgi:hypothetical protein